MPDAHGIHVVMDPEDDLETMRLLQSLGNLARGRIVVSPSPGARDSAHWIARDVLIALGKRVPLTGTGRNAYELWRRTVIWAAAEEVREVFVLRAHLMGRRTLDRYVELGASIGARVWFIHQAPSLRRGQREWLEDHDVETEDLLAFEQAWAHLATGDEPPFTDVPSAAFPQVPRDEFTTFRSACRRLLATPDHRTVDQRFTWAVRESMDALGYDLSGDALHTAVLASARAHCRSTGMFDEALTLLRALQVAAFRHGALLRIDIPKLAGGWACEGPPISEEELSIRLRWNTCTRRAALGALAAGRSCAPSELAEVTIADAMAVIAGEHQSLEVAPSLRPLVRAQVMCRREDGAADGDPLLTGFEQTMETTVLRPRAIQRLLRELTRETGVLFPGSSLTARHDDDRQWARASGLTVMGF